MSNFYCFCHTFLRHNKLPKKNNNPNRRFNFVLSFYSDTISKQKKYKQMQNVKDIAKMAIAITIGILVANQITPLVTKAKAA